MPFDSSNPNLRDLYSRKKRLATAKKSFKESQKFSEPDKLLVLDFIRDCEQGKTGKRRNSIVRELRLIKLLYWLPRVMCWYDRPLSVKDEAAFSDMMARMDSDIISRRDGKPFSHETKLGYKKIILQFWRWLSAHFNDPEYFDMADKNVRYVTKELDPDAYSYDEIWQMSRNQPIHYEFLFKLLFDGGFRTTEAWNIRKKDIIRVQKADDAFFKVRIRSDTSKTKGRTISVRLCTDVIERYLSAHPELTDEDFVVQVKVNSARKYLGRVSKEKIGQRVTFTVLRHCSMSHYAPLVKNQTRLEYRYGECTGSRAIAHYIKRSGILDDETAEEIKTDQILKVTSRLSKVENEKMALQEKVESVTSDNVRLRSDIQQIREELLKIKECLLVLGGKNSEMRRFVDFQ